MRKIKLNNIFHAYWGIYTPKQGDVFEIIREDEKGYWVNIPGVSRECRIWKSEADLVNDIPAHL